MWVDLWWYEQNFKAEGGQLHFFVGTHVTLFDWRVIPSTYNISSVSGLGLFSLDHEESEWQNIKHHPSVHMKPAAVLDAY